MNSDSEPVPAITLLFTPEFKRNVRQLAKKYRRIKSDLESLFSDLEQGQTPGDQVPGVQYKVYKVRVKNSDNNKGKSGGYRVIYQHTDDDDIILVTIYSKSEQSDVAVQELRDIILAHNSPPPTEARPTTMPSEEPPSDDTPDAADADISLADRN